MENAQLASLLNEICTLMELAGEDSFRSGAFARAARTIETLPDSVAGKVEAGSLDSVPGLGKTLKDTVSQLVQTGTCKQLDDLREKTPPGLILMLRIPGVGPKKVRAMHLELAIDTLAKLKDACESGKVATLKGFGDKTQAKILEGLAFVELSSERVRLDQAMAVAEPLVAAVRAMKGVEHAELAGSLRRRRETVKDIDIVATVADTQKATSILEAFTKLKGVERVVGQGDTKASVVARLGEGTRALRINADLRVVSTQAFPYALNYFTGSKEHNVALRQRAQALGFKLNEYGLEGDAGNKMCSDEPALYKALGLDYVQPELRENTGEVQAAIDHKLPELVNIDQVMGVFHNHTVASDGANTLEEMAEAARALGYKWLGIGDHSQSLTIANGLSPERVRDQWREIDRLNKKWHDFRILKGSEVDILADGSLDFDDNLLAGFDYVVASVHTHFNQPREEMTARIVKALENPFVTMLGHPTGRLLLRREAYAVDLEAVLQAAKKHDKWVEINANPMRLDLDWVHCRRAREIGVKLVTNPDAHAADELANTIYGVEVARRGWVGPAQLANTLDLNGVLAELEARRKKV